jgi:hypothetical protein
MKARNQIKEEQAASVNGPSGARYTETLDFLIENLERLLFLLPRMTATLVVCERANARH